MSKQLINVCECSWMETDGKSIWYLTETGGILMKVDQLTGELQFEGRIPDAELGELSHRSIVYLNKKIYVLPYYSDKIWVYDTYAKIFDELDVPLTIKELFEGKAEIFGGIIQDDNIYMYGLSNYIVKYNVCTNEFCSWRTETLENSFKGIRFWKNGFVSNNNVVIPSNKEAAVVITDDSCKVLAWETKLNWYSSIVLPYGNKICFVGISENGDYRVDILDIDKDDINVISHGNCAHNHSFDGKAPFSAGTIVGDELYVMPGCQPNGYIISLKNGKKKAFKLLNDERADSFFAFCGIFVKNGFICIDSGNNLVIRLDLSSLEVAIKELYMEKEVISDIYKLKSNAEKEIIIENRLISLDSYIKILKES